MSDFYKVIPIFNNVYRITSYEAVFCELIIGKTKAMLIDSGYAFGNLKAVVKNLTQLPLIIVNTHGHVDHVCGNCQFDEPVFIGDADAELCIAHSSPEMRLKSARFAEHAINWSTGNEVYGLPVDFNLESYCKCGAGELLSLSEGMEFDLGNSTIEVIHTPGHTRGCHSFFYKEKQILYTGDQVNPFHWLFGPESTDRNTHITTLKKISGLDLKFMYGGHAPQSISRYELSLFIRAAEEADYSKGEPFFTPLSDITDARVCALDGMSMRDIGKPGFASIIITSDK